MNSQEWWEDFENNKPDLSDIIHRFHPASDEYNKSVRAFPVTAQRAENACERFRKNIRGKYGNAKPSRLFTLASTQHDIRLLVTILEETWIGLPESSQIRKIAGYFALCRLIEFPSDLTR